MKITLPPSFEGYAVSRVAEFVHIALEGGLGRTRRDVIDATRRVNVKWRVSKAGHEYLTKVHRYYVSHNAEEFTIDLIVDTPSPVEHVAHFVPGTFGLESFDGIRYVWRAQMDVLPVTYTTWPAYNGDVPDTGLFLDNFTGSAVELSVHTPDIAPPGYVWTSRTGTMNLDGTGDVVPVGGAEYGDGYDDHTWNRPIVPDVFYYEIAFRNNSADNYFIHFSFTGGGFGNRWAILVNTTQKPTSQITFYYIDEADAQQTPGIGSDYDLINVADYRITVEVNKTAGTITGTLYVDGVLDQQNATDPATFEAVTLLGRVGLSLTADADQLTVTRVAIQEGAAP